MRFRLGATRNLRRALSTLRSPTDLDVQHFASIVGGANVLTSPADLEPYNTDWMRKYVGNSKLAVRPGSTAEVSRVLAHCHAERIGVVPQGGNTGLVGGSVPVADEVVLSLGRMDRVLSVDEDSGHLVCEAGCVLDVHTRRLARRSRRDVDEQRGQERAHKLHHPAACCITGFGPRA